MKKGLLEQPKIPTEKLVLSYIVRNGVSSRKEIAKKIGVTTATLTNIVSELIENGIIYEMGVVEEGKVGRKQIMINVKSDIKYVIGFDVTNITIRVSVLNIKAEIKEIKRWDFDKLTQDILNEAIIYTKNVIEKFGEKNFLGIGLLMQGYIEDSNCYSLPIKNIKEQLSKKFCIDIFMMNNVKGLAVTESYFGNECQNYLLIKYGPGVGGVIVVNGEILEGFRNRAGEIGHIVWDLKSEKKCMVCGKYGCLESIINFSSVINNSNPKMNIVYPDTKALLEASENDNMKSLNYAFNQLAIAVNMLIDIIDPEEVLFAGEIFEYESILNNLIKKVAKNNKNFDISKIYKLENYKEKRIKAAGVIVLNEYFGKGLRLM